METFPISPGAIVASTWASRNLIRQMTVRDVIGRYRGSIMGILWSFFNPIFMLTIYTFFFSVVFKARWRPDSDSKAEFAIVLFAGLLVFNLFSECLNKAPTLIIANANYVKKVVFPLEILPIVTIGSALFHSAISVGVWVLFYTVFFGLPPITALLLPVVVLPLIFLTLGLSWFLASIGVFIRDVSQMIGIVLTATMFLSPIFYPISSLPPAYQSWMFLNPLTQIIENTRSVLILGKLPEPTAFATHCLISLSICWLGFAWFQKTRKGFSDVL